MDWGSIIAGGIAIANQLLGDEENEEQRGFDRETTILQLQDNERARAAQAERQAELLASNLQIAQLGNAADLEQVKKRIMGDVLLQQGQGQEKLMLEDFRASANAPERFNSAANVLATVLAR